MVILPVGGHEMVLGVHWLSTLRKVTIEYDKLLMKFVYKGKEVVLRGTQKKDKEISLKEMERLS